MKVEGEISGLWFLAFADSRLESTLRRIRQQAEDMHVFGDRILTFTERDLDADFQERMAKHLLPGSRGFGYWCWKPQIVLQVLKEMDDGDVLLYADAGCHLNPKGIVRLREYVGLARKHQIVAFQARSNGKASLPENHFLLDGAWCTGDMLDFGVRNNEEIIKTGQYAATTFLVCKSDFSLRFFKEFLDMFYEHFSLCDDTPSNSANLQGFCWNRYDQSIFSLKCKLARLPALPLTEIEPIRTYMPRGGDAADWPDKWGALRGCPILARRDKGQRRLVCPDWLKPFVSVRTRNELAKWISFLQ